MKKVLPLAALSLSLCLTSGAYAHEPWGSPASRPLWALPPRGQLWAPSLPTAEPWPTSPAFSSPFGAELRSWSTAPSRPWELPPKTEEAPTFCYHFPLPGGATLSSCK